MSTVCSGQRGYSCFPKTIWYSQPADADHFVAAINASSTYCKLPSVFSLGVGKSFDQGVSTSPKLHSTQNLIEPQLQKKEKSTIVGPFVCVGKCSRCVLTARAISVQLDPGCKRRCLTACMHEPNISAPSVCEKSIICLSGATCESVQSAASSGEIRPSGTTAVASTVISIHHLCASRSPICPIVISDMTTGPTGLCSTRGASPCVTIAPNCTGTWTTES